MFVVIPAPPPTEMALSSVPVGGVFDTLGEFGALFKLYIRTDTAIDQAGRITCLNLSDFRINYLHENRWCRVWPNAALVLEYKGGDS